MSQEDLRINMAECPKNQMVSVYDSNNNLLTETDSDLTFTWIRSQIHKKGLKGYYIVYNNVRYDIDHRGNLNWPDGLFEKILDCMLDLIS